MATSKLPSLPESPLTTGFRAIEAILREDPVLKDAVNTWATWTGAPDDTAPPQDAAMPWIRLTPWNSPNMRDYIDLDKVDFVISVEMAVEGTCVDNLLNLWQAVHDALIRTKEFRGVMIRRYLRNTAGGSNLRFTLPNFCPIPPAKPGPNAAAGPYLCYAESRIIYLKLMPA